MRGDRARGDKARGDKARGDKERGDFSNKLGLNNFLCQSVYPRHQYSLKFVPLFT